MPQTTRGSPFTVRTEEVKVGWGRCLVGGGRRCYKV